MVKLNLLTAALLCIVSPVGLFSMAIDWYNKYVALGCLLQ